MHVQAYMGIFYMFYFTQTVITVMTNTAPPKPKSVSKRTEREHVQPVRFSDMGMGTKASIEVEKKQPIVATV